MSYMAPFGGGGLQGVCGDMETGQRSYLCVLPIFPPRFLPPRLDREKSYATESNSVWRPKQRILFDGCGCCRNRRPPPATTAP